MSDPMQPNATGSAFATAAAAASASPPVQPQGGNKREQVVEALMRLAAEQPWDDIELVDIAREAGLSLSEMRDLFPSKGAILEGFTRMIDKKVIDGTTEDLAGEPARERVFDVFMRRLDAMAPYKRALRRIAYAMRSDPLSMAALNRSALNSMRYMLAAAGVPTEGPLGFVKLQGSVIALANVMETWFDDDDVAQARTMARLDRELTRGERLLERADDVRRLTAPLRAIGQALFDGGRRMRRRGERDRRDGEIEGEARDPAAAI
ncbi:TetR/AcrR family transcriptional regulator [Enterovirga aerilata]|uniref:TetR/AcrR family transcriptional regulator n=1 Tax=Enterovirga aerilata TaxID=2730920 RepID=UPI001FEEB667|nr:TetR/AcrR family transcriptional regulator [Enterovirga sp. DB1703]